jgi:hypothetical protein
MASGVYRFCQENSITMEYTVPAMEQKKAKMKGKPKA